jgi:hypothetical protein
VAKVVVTKTVKAAAKARARSSVREKRVRNSAGEVVRITSLDANSRSFDDDLTYVFAKNIAKARRENRKLFGTADGSRSKK